jgi:hypothetical protein
VREPPSDAAITEGTLLDDLREERHASAEARTRRIVREGGAIAGARALLPWVALHNLDYGHGAIFLAKALELSARFPEHAEDLFGALALGLAWATRETALPPWAATRRALDAVDALGGFGAEALSGSTRQDYEAAVLEGERAAAEATVAHLSAGASATSLLRASARAAARRLLRFDPTWERRRDANVTVLDITHTVTFAESCLALAPHASARELARFAVLSATFVGKVRKGDASEPLGAHDLDDAPARDSVRRLDAAGRAAAFRDLAPHVAFDAATRPIRYAHTIKTAEALFRLDRDDPEPDAVYLEALLAYVVPQRPERDHRRAAEIALRFLDDGRPPPGLY